MPLRINSTLDEPYLQLPAPHENIRITPMRLSDAPFSTAALNAPEVVPFLSGPPFPFHEENAISFLNETKPPADLIYQEIREKVLAGENDYIASGTPVSAIREVQTDGSELWIGDIGFIRSSYHEVEDETERARLVAVNASKKDGDPSIVWSYGNILAPSHHRRGITGAVLHEMIHGWAIPHLNTKHIIATAFTDNIGSQKVMLKNGFQYIGKVATNLNMEHKGRVDTSLFVYEWKI